MECNHCDRKTPGCNMNRNSNCNMNPRMNWNMNRNTNSNMNRNSGCNTNSRMNCNMNRNTNSNMNWNMGRNTNCNMNHRNNDKECNDERRNVKKDDKHCCEMKCIKDEGCDRGNEPVDKMKPGMGFVPWQEWRDVFCIEDGLEKGTIFEELHKPYLGRPVE